MLNQLEKFSPIHQRLGLLFSGLKSFSNSSNVAFYFFLEFDTTVNGDSCWGSGKGISCVHILHAQWITQTSSISVETVTPVEEDHPNVLNLRMAQRVVVRFYQSLFTQDILRKFLISPCYSQCFLFYLGVASFIFSQGTRSVHNWFPLILVQL